MSNIPMLRPGTRVFVYRPKIFYQYDWKTTKVMRWKEKLIKPTQLATWFAIMNRRPIYFYDVGEIEVVR